MNVSRIAQQRPFVALPRKSTKCQATSVSGNIYSSEDPDAPSVRLFTKEGCTLCDKVKDVLEEIKEQHPHSLEQIDITDEDKTEFRDRYKYDIPVLHLNGEYWIKHRLTAEEAIQGLAECREGTFQSPPGEPDAAKMEH